LCWLVAFTVGCELNPPDLQQLFWQRTIFEDREADAVYAMLSVYVQAQDADGDEDLDALFVIHDRERLFWSLDPDSWEEVTRTGARWIGSNTLTVANGGDFPVGEYRVVVQDAAGEVDQESFSLAGEIPQAAWEVFAESQIIMSGTSVILAGWPEPAEVWLYPADPAGDRLAAGTLDPAGQLDMGALVPERIRDQDFTLFFYSYSEAWGVGIFSGPYAWSRPTR